MGLKPDFFTLALDTRRQFFPNNCFTYAYPYHLRQSGQLSHAAGAQGNLGRLSKNNPLLGIGGAMCFLDGVYLQLLEGEAVAVDALYQKIEKDPRHTHVRMLAREPIGQREYPKWSMALLTWNEETKAIFNLFNPNIACDLYAADPATVAAMMRAWAGTNNWMTL